MSSTVKNISVNCNAINEKNTFTSGDFVSGQITLELAKDCQIDSLSIKFKGKAEVLWTERHGNITVVYHSKDKYFSIKQYFIREQKGQDDLQALLTDQSGKAYCNVVAPGCHVYPFTFQIPAQDMPSSFDGSRGKIVYSLEAKLSRSMRIDSKASTKINFVSRVDPDSILMLMKPQHESKDKKMKFLNSGTVGMDVNIEKMGYCQGEGIKVVASIQNNSSREIKPKYCVYRKHSFFARGERRVGTKDLLKEVGEPIPPSANQTVTRVINIPPDIDTSILNCSIIKAEYRLRVYLDVKYASDPEIKFPIVILPASQHPFAPQPVEHPFAPQPVEPPPPYGTYEMYPSLSDFDKKC
ncbi:arrestin domain-containing protein 3-like isoform X3 [Centroberyx affinis]|uniref:arrestin domain-containing protein 3-like isoform X3 n=1 Tax=Centroberyx affinis TaxID=166261 RepID=UPI003A5C20F7